MIKHALGLDKKPHFQIGHLVTFIVSVAGKVREKIEHPQARHLGLSFLSLCEPE